MGVGRVRRGASPSSPWLLWHKSLLAVSDGCRSADLTKVKNCAMLLSRRQWQVELFFFNQIGHVVLKMYFNVRH